MIGDNLEWEIEVRSALASIDLDGCARRRPPPTPPSKPDRIIRSLTELLLTKQHEAFAAPKQDPGPAPNQKYRKQTPCKVTGRSLACAMPATTFDTSGKSAALIYGADSLRRAGIHFTSPHLFAGVKGVGERPLLVRIRTQVRHRVTSEKCRVEV